MDFIEITQFVKHYSEGSQLQSIKTYRKGALWLLGLDFYPAPRGVLIGLNPHSKTPSFTIEASRTGLLPSAHPLQLYMRAHFQNQRLQSVQHEVGSTRLVFNFLPSQAQCFLDFSPRGEIVCELRVSEKKPYFQTLPLGLLPLDDANLGEPMTNAPSPSSPNQDGLLTSHLDNRSEAEVLAATKKARMLSNIQGDVDTAMRWLLAFENICKVVAENPQAWLDGKVFSDLERECIQHEIDQGLLPPFGPGTLGRANDSLFSRRRKLQKKLEGGRRRWAQVEKMPLKKFADLKKQYKGGPATTDGVQKSKKITAGLWVELRPELWARIGRSAVENAQLFREARDRDLWFHVRGQAGAHVWIGRGQGLLSNKEEPPEWMLEEGAMLAVYNSKARSSGAAFVDISERRHLRSLKGAGPGMLEIMRSKTRYVKLDLAFESRLKGK